MTTLTDLIGDVPAPGAYAILAAAVLAESVLLLGAFVPTLALLLAAGALARAGELNLALVIVTASCAVVTGDALGHRTGHLLGSRLRTGALGRRIPAAAWRRAEALMTERGGQAVFLARFVPVLRTLAPHLAGVSRLPYRHIAPYSLLAAPLWAGAESTAGYAAATSLQHALALGGPALAATAVLFIGALAALGRIRRRAEAHTEAPRPVEPGLLDDGTGVPSAVDGPVRGASGREQLPEAHGVVFGAVGGPERDALVAGTVGEFEGAPVSVGEDGRFRDGPDALPQGEGTDLGGGRKKPRPLVAPYAATGL